MTLISILESLITFTPTVVADILPVQVYCPLSDVCSGENISMPVVTMPSVIEFIIIIRSPLIIVPSGPVHMMEIFLDLTPSTVSTVHIIENISPAIELPSVITVTSGGPRSGVRR